MRVLLVLAVVCALGARAHAFRPRTDPQVVRFCRTAASWHLRLDCLTTAAACSSNTDEPLR